MSIDTVPRGDTLGTGDAVEVPGASLELTPAQLEVVRGILRAHVPALEVRAFGARLTRAGQRLSDLDLLIVSAGLAPRVAALLADAFAESYLPFKVDVVDASCLAPDVLERTLRHSIVVHAARR